VARHRAGVHRPGARRGSDGPCCSEIKGAMPLSSRNPPRTGVPLPSSSSSSSSSDPPLAWKKGEKTRALGHRKGGARARARFGDIFFYLAARIRCPIAVVVLCGWGGIRDRFSCVDYSPVQPGQVAERLNQWWMLGLWLGNLCCVDGRILRCTSSQSSVCQVAAPSNSV
jgi:hypothetical protein